MEADIGRERTAAASETSDGVRSPTLHELAARVCEADDADAFRHLYGRCVGRVYAVCQRILANTARAEEATQVAFVRAWTQRHSLRQHDHFEGWLKRIAINVSLGMIRRSSRTRSFDAGVEMSQTMMPSSGDAIDLERAIASLPDRCRTVFVLHDVEGYRHREIAEMMSTSVGTSKVQLFRARQKLREALRL